MIRIGTLQQALGNRRPLTLANGTPYFKSDFIASVPEDAIAPQAFLIEQGANSTIRPHFHTENQFQVVVDGKAMLGRHPVAPIGVHYASRHTGYGPIDAGPQGVSYFTLRDRVTAQAHFLPESRDQMADVPRRNLFADRVDVPFQAVPAAAEVSEVIPLQNDGVAAWSVRLGTGQSIALPLPAGGADRFYLVVSGAMTLGAETLTRLATVFCSADEAPLMLTPASDLLQVLVLQYPEKSTA